MHTGDCACDKLHGVQPPAGHLAGQSALPCPGSRAMRRRSTCLPPSLQCIAPAATGMPISFGKIDMKTGFCNRASMHASKFFGPPKALPDFRCWIIGHRRFCRVEVRVPAVSRMQPKQSACRSTRRRPVNRSHRQMQYDCGPEYVSATVLWTTR